MEFAHEKLRFTSEGQYSKFIENTLKSLLMLKMRFWAHPTNPLSLLHANPWRRKW